MIVNMYFIIVYCVNKLLNQQTAWQFDLDHCDFCKTIFCAKHKGSFGAK